ncbi:hypothetical protein E3P81_02831 [Wallemia ichthyophaga]|nr:hypothetical protein E3P97_02872 [Wallemia ichthyophaga]TIA94602.1 hypothetical protein E3P96_04095 [Wallemia ichthyophaga]TIB29697.1 hypothetical protein E3P85_03064 [Wallemia ichthyophaga]TIB45431.1 hypothetical protein E3P82_02801 [Wallemia ichthyophaga]TIB48663.1 hypothetical protein E3P81_02831 [Wallemia ichthyophaga]
MAATITAIPTPDLSHLKRDDWDRVYEPSEDTFALLDALEMDSEWIKSSQPNVVFEIGSGTTISTGDLNGCNLNTINTHLLNGTRLDGAVDILLFNPPYVPTNGGEILHSQASRHLSAAWSGGSYGMDLTERVLSDLPRLLSGSGVLYLVAIKQNRPADIVDRLNRTSIFEASILLSRRAGIEMLYIIKCSRK